LKGKGTMPTKSEMKGGLDIDKEAVDQFLKINPDYAKEWFAKNGPGIGLPSGSTAPVSITVTHTHGAPAAAGNTSSFNVDVDKKDTELTANIFKDYIDGTRTRKVSFRQLDVARLRELNEHEMFMELIRDIANELDVNVLCHKIIMNVSILTNSDRGSLFLAKGPADNRYLYPKLFDVTAVSTLEESLKAAERGFYIPFGKGIAGHVAQTKEIVNINEAYDVSRKNYLSNFDMFDNDYNQSLD
jgi:cGMP-specific 3',5'-cyclic phosphodiesterase